MRCGSPTPSCCCSTVRSCTTAPSTASATSRSGSSRRARLAGSVRVPSAEELFGPSGTPRVVVVGAGFGGIAMGVKLHDAGIDSFTIYESSLGIGGTWWDNTYPGAEVDVGLEPLLLLLQAPRLDAHPREAARAAEVPRGDGRRARPPPPSPARRRRESAEWDDERHVWTVRLDDGTVDECHVLVERGRLPQRPAVPRLAGARRVPGSGVPHRTLGAPARPDRQGRRGRRHRVVGDPGRAGDPTDRASTSTCSSASPGWVMPKGERDLTRRGARDVLASVATQARSLAPEVPARAEPVGRASSIDPRPRSTRSARRCAAGTSPASSPTGPICARRSRRPTRTRGSGRSSPAPSIPRSSRRTSSSSRGRWRR